MQGPLSGLRRTFFTHSDGVYLLSDRADVLAELHGARLDPAAIALRLSVPHLPCGYTQSPVWSEVDAVPENAYAELPGDGTMRIGSRWTPPRERFSVSEAAALLRAALAEAVAARTAQPRALSCDLSGGLDSTSLCCLAAAQVEELLAVTSSNGSEDDEDLEWSARAAQEMGGLERLMLLGDDLPTPFSDLCEPGPPGDEALPDVRDRSEILGLARPLRACGADLHLTGDGGDELLHTPPVYLHDLARREPWLAIAQARSCQVAALAASPLETRAVSRTIAWERWLRDLPARRGAVTSSVADRAIRQTVNAPEVK